MSAIRTDHVPQTMVGSRIAARRAQTRSVERTGNGMLWFVAITSLLLNILIISTLLVARGLITNSVPRANTYLFNALETIETTPVIQLPVNINREVPINTNQTLMFRDTIAVPIQSSVQVEDVLVFSEEITVPIQETIRIEEYTSVPITLNGVTTYSSVPIVADVPLNIEIVVPIQKELPISLNVPFETTLNVDIEEEIPLVTADGQPFMVDLDMQATVPVPVNEILNNFSIISALEEMHRTLNILEHILFLPLPH